MKTCIIIGAKGFIGSALAAEARGRGYASVEVTRENYDELKGAKAEVLINAGGNSRKFIDDRDPVHGFELSVTSVMKLQLPVFFAF